MPHREHPAPASLIAGVELGGTKCVCILGSGPGEPTEAVRIATTDPATTLAAIEAVLDRWAGSPGFTALGLGCFGPIELDPAAADWGRITSTPKPGWQGTDIAARLRRRYGVPTAVHTDVVGAALAEARWGAGRGLTDLAYVTVGTGIGVGILAAGAPLGGFMHGELGHLRIVRAGGDVWPGACLFHGDCVEGLASGPAIAARTGHAAATLAGDDPVWDRVAYALGQLLHAVVVTAAPHRIIMGGGVMAQAHLLPRIRTALKTSLNGYVVHPLLGPQLGDYVVPASLGERAGSFGALALGLDARAGIGGA